MNQKNPRHLTIGYVRILSFAQLFVINELELHKEAGIELSLRAFSSAPEAYSSVKNSDLDLIYSGFAPPLKYTEQGIDIRILAPSTWNSSCFVSRGTFGEMVDRIGLEDAFGKFPEQHARRLVIGTLSEVSVSNRMLQEFLNRMPLLKKENIQIMHLPERELERLLSAGYLDAALTKEPVISLAQAADPTVKIQVPGDKLAFFGANGGVCAVKPIDDGLIDDFLAIHGKATVYLQNNAKEIAPRLLSYLDIPRESFPAFEKAIVNSSSHYTCEPHLLAPAITELHQFLLEQNEITAELDLSRLINFPKTDLQMHPSIVSQDRAVQRLEP